MGVRSKVKSHRRREAWWSAVAVSLRRGLAPLSSSVFSAFQAAGQHKAGRRRVLHPTSKRPLLGCTGAPAASPAAEHPCGVQDQGDAALPKAAARYSDRLPTRWENKREHGRHFLLFSLFPQTPFTFGQTHFSYSKEGANFFHEG